MNQSNPTNMTKGELISWENCYVLIMLIVLMQKLLQ